MEIAIKLTALQQSDWPAVSAIYKQGIASGLATFETECPTWEQWDANHFPFCRFVARDQNEVVGWAALSPVSKRECYKGVAEVSVYVSSASQRKGIGWALLEAIIDASEQNGIWTLQGATFAENIASIKLQEQCGFRVIGYRERVGQLNGIWHDTILMERRSKVVGK